MKLLEQIGKQLHSKALVALACPAAADPFVKILLGKEMHKSEIVKKTLNPRWDKVRTRDGWRAGARAGGGRPR